MFFAQIRIERPELTPKFEDGGHDVISSRKLLPPIQ